MTQVEEKVLRAWQESMPHIKFKPETHLQMIKDSMRATAYHESGHAAVNAFLGVYGLSHFEGITMIPMHAYKGCVWHSRILPLRFSKVPKAILQIQGKMRILFLLAGRVSENKAGYVDGLPFDDLFEWGTSDCDTEDEWRRSTDEGKALEVAELLSSKTWPPFRILYMMGKWTRELIDISDVWSVIERMAQRLIEEGELNFDQYYELIQPISYKYPGYPAWKRRFSAEGVKAEKCLPC